jgi:hypothetical protein
LVITYLALLPLVDEFGFVFELEIGLVVERHKVLVRIVLVGKDPISIDIHQVEVFVIVVDLKVDDRLAVD